MIPRSLDPLLSVVIPVHNEEQNVGPLHGEIQRVLDALGRSYEIIFVNDGSEDETLACLRRVREEDARVRILDLDGNFGEAAALSAGLHAARGEIVVTIDGDGQNDPGDIPPLVEALETPGMAVVSGRRDDRQEDAWRRIIPSRVANALIARVTGLPTHDCGCGLKAYRRSAVPRLHLPRGMNRFLPAIFGVAPHQVAEIPTRDRHRQHGVSHYGIGRTLVVLRDLLALPFLVRNPRRAEVALALSTVAAAGLGAALLDVSRIATAALDVVAVLCGVVWWNVRRFNRTQSEGAYRLRQEHT